jgi:hypothetical protein
MRKVMTISCIFAMSAGLMLCNKTSNSVGSGGAEIAWSYITKPNDTIIMTDPGTTFTWCDSANPNQRDTSIQAPAKDTMLYTLSGNTMVVMDQYGDTQAVCTRSGTGSGMVGTWNTVFYQGSDNGMNVTMNGTIQVTASTFTLTSVCNAHLFMAEEGSFYSEPEFNITDTEVSCSQVRMTGNTSKEVVTASFSQPVLDFDYIGDCNITFTSSNARHAAFTLYADPATCPNEMQAWFDTFLIANPGTVAKRVEPSSSAASTALQKMRLLRKMKIF